MKQSDLNKILGEDIENWEIVNVGYDKCLNLLLREFEWEGLKFCLDRKKYTSKIKKLKILDEFAFNYYVDDNLVNAIYDFLEKHEGINLKYVDDLIHNPQKILTTDIQTEWKNILIKIGCFDEQKYKKLFLEELKKQLIVYYKDNPNKNVLLEKIKFLEDVVTDLKI